jgi:hypothetical protein
MVVAGMAVLAAGLLAGCGGGGRSLEAWAEEANAICDDLADKLPDDDADDAEDDIDEAVEALQGLAPPSGEDAEVAEDAVDSLESGLQDSRELLANVDRGDDAFEQAAAAIEGPDLDDELDDIEASGADACADALEDGVGDLDGLAARIELLDDVVDIRVGDCVVLDPIDRVDCEDGADAEVLLTSFDDEDPACPDEADTTQTVEESDGDLDALGRLCLRSLVGPDDDGFLEVGSCLSEDPEDQTFLEVACDSPDATHEVVFGASDESVCLETDVVIDASEEEIEAFAVAVWCVEAA